MTTLVIYFGLLIVNIIASIDLLVMKNAMLSSTKWKACLGKTLKANKLVMVISYGSKSLICSEFQFYDFVVLRDITLFKIEKK